LKKRSRFGLKAKRGLDVFGGKGKWSSSDKPKDGKGNAQKPEDWEKVRSIYAVAPTLAILTENVSLSHEVQLDAVVPEIYDRCQLWT
jgi:hypothetical protein